MLDKELVKKLVGTNDLDDSLISFYENCTEQWMLGYLGVERIPKELIPILTEVVVTRIKTSTKDNHIDIGQGKVSSVSDGNQTVSFTSSTVGDLSTEESILAKYGALLDRYRCMTVSRPVSRTLKDKLYRG